MMPRESGIALDAFVLQFADLPSLKDDGPPASAMKKDGYFLEFNRVIGFAAAMVMNSGKIRHTPVILVTENFHRSF